MNELFCCKAAEGLKARFDTTHQNFEVFHGALPQPDGSPTLLGGCSPWRCHTLAPPNTNKKPRPKSGLFTYVVVRVAARLQRFYFQLIQRLVVALKLGKKLLNCSFWVFQTTKFIIKIGEFFTKLVIDR